MPVSGTPDRPPTLPPLCLTSPAWALCVASASPWLSLLLLSVSVRAGGVTVGRETMYFPTTFTLTNVLGAVPFTAQDKKGIDDMVHHCRALDQRLAKAEARNDELAERLTMTTSLLTNMLTHAQERLDEHEERLAISGVASERVGGDGGYGKVAEAAGQNTSLGTQQKSATSEPSACFTPPSLPSRDPGAHKDAPVHRQDDRQASSRAKSARNSVYTIKTPLGNVRLYWLTGHMDWK